MQEALAGHALRHCQFSTSVYGINANKAMGSCCNRPS